MAPQRFDQSRYDEPAPWWFRNTLWLGLPFTVPMSVAVGYGILPLFVVVLILVLSLGVLALAWERRHRIR